LDYGQAEEEELLKEHPQHEDDLRNDEFEKSLDELVHEERGQNKRYN